MTSSSADPIEEIAAFAMSSFANAIGKYLVYVEVEEGVISSDLFFQKESSNSVQFRFASQEIQDIIYSFWESGHGKVLPRSWATMQLVVHHGHFTADFLFPDQVTPNEGVSDRRPRVLAAQFPGLPVDYSFAR